jgi:predicted GNAT family acetyltransferase
MSTQEGIERLELLQGTLDLLILRTLMFGRQHGQGIARAIQQTSQEELLVEHGLLSIPLCSAWNSVAGSRRSYLQTIARHASIR